MKTGIARARMSPVPAAIALAGLIWALFALAAPAAPGGASQGDGARGSKDPGAPVNIDFLKAGGALYDEHCLSCHQEDGKGVTGTFPPLAGNPALADQQLVVNTVHGGHSGLIQVNGKPFDQTMPAVGTGFTAKEIAEVGTFIRNSWGNEFGGVEVDAVRQLLQRGSGGPVGSALPVDGALLKEGEGLYRLHCGTCHQLNGKGIAGTFPPLADNTALKDAALIVKTVRTGHSGMITVNGRTLDQTMPAVGAGFSAEQLAAVATYIRNSWGNDFGGVSQAEVEKILGNLPVK
jgi:mono/diheme cytochrome c family protein